MGRQRHRHRLHGEIVRRLSPQLSRTAWTDERRGRAGVFARRFHLGQRPGARQNSARLRRIHHRSARGWKQSDPDGPHALSRLLSRFRHRRGRHRDVGSRARHRIVAALSGDQLRRLGLEHSRTVPRARSFIRELKQFEQTRQYPESHHRLPAERPHQRHREPVAPRPPRKWPTTTWPSAKSSRP